MNNETPADLARILSFAATYMEERGRARFRFGGRAGRAACPVAAIGLALGYDPRRIGRGWFFMMPNEAHRAIGSVILRTGLLDDLPVPADSGGRRRLRPAGMSPRRAVQELAIWSDDKPLCSLVISALRHRAVALMGSWSQTSGRLGSHGATQVAHDSKSIREAPSDRGVLMGRQPARDRNHKREPHGSQS